MNDPAGQRKGRLARAQLSLEGLSLGDAFGQCFFDPHLRIRQMHRDAPAGPWFYTDDTMMAISLVEVLAEHDRVDQDLLAERFAERFTRQPQRGYGGGAIRLLAMIGAGADWRQAAPAMFGGAGSMGNGGAMRVAPLGAYFAGDTERVVDEARASAVVTHAHPEGQAGAIAVAVAAAVATTQGREQNAGRVLLETVLALTPTGRTREGIAKALEFDFATATEIAATALGNGSMVTAPDTVPFAVWNAARHLDNFEEAMWTTVDALGDIDTNCAIVGGIVAMAVGRQGLPAAWLRRREPLED